METLWKRLLSGVMAIVVMLSLLPVTALASLLNNDPAVNREILDQLEQICGSPEEAERYYGLLCQYGLLNEEGAIPESWSVTMDGQDITLDELRKMLSGDYDPEKLVLVDGTPVTLENLETILAIEDYIAYLRSTYFNGCQWSEEEEAALTDLVKQIETSGIQMYVDNHIASWPSGISHEARVSVSSSDGVNFTATLTGALESQTVSFDWNAVSGSQPASGSGTVNLTADASGSATGTFSITRGAVSTEGVSPVRSTADLVYYINLSNIKNALFTQNGIAKSNMSMELTTNGTLSFMQSGSFTVSGTLTAYSEEAETEEGFGTIYGNRDYTHTFTQAQKTAIAWGQVNQVEIQQTTHSDVSESGLEVLTSPNSGLYKFYLVHFQAQTDGFVWSGGTYGKLNPISSYESSYGGGPFQIEPDKIGDTIVFSGANQYQTSSHGPDDDWAIGFEGPYTEDLAVSAVFSDTRTMGATAYSVPTGTYYPGQVVPVTVTFGEPVQTTGAAAVINGSTVNAAGDNGGSSNVLTFPYTVKESDSSGLFLTKVSATDGINAATETTYNTTIPGAVLQTPNPTAAFAGMNAEIVDPLTEPTLIVSLQISGNHDITQWVGGDFESVDGVLTSKSLSVSVDGGVNRYPLTAQTEAVTGGTLTASIPLPVNTGENDAFYTAELFRDAGLVFGQFAAAALSPAKFITEEVLSVSLFVADKDGGDYLYADDTHTIYLQDDPQITASYQLTGSGYSFAGADQFDWSSSDPTIANIDRSGKISPTGKAGSATFTLTAKNGGVEGKAVSVTTDSLQFGVGLTPFLSIPNDELESVSGQSVAVYWTSNLCDKNGDMPTEFFVKVMRGNQAVYTTTVTGTASNPAASAAIPGNVLTYDYSGSDNNRFAVTVSAVYQEKEYSAAAIIDLSSKPAVVTFDKLDSYYITDAQGPVNISWSIENFDRYASDDAANLFQLLITKDGQEVYKSSDPGSGSGTFSGSFTLSDTDVAGGGGPMSYRDVYTVTIQAKNGLDSTWSYDSFMLYIYDADALKIWIDGEDKSSFSMSNIPTISKMNQDQILALKRDIHLKNIISVNYGEYAWSELADQIVWKSSDSQVVSVNYQQGTLYENIEDYAYVSYRPTTDFGLSGLEDGMSTITATHKLTGMQDRLDVQVETLKDKLYLFQCYPQTAATLTYTNGTGQEKTVATDSAGAAAVYEESGIASDVYCSAEKDGITYLGTFYRETLETGEGDWTRLERYPCNNLELRRAAYAYLYIKKPDDSPYTGSVVIRGGVYVDGVYRPDALFGFGSGSAVNRCGDTDNIVSLGKDGRLDILMDQGQWDLEGDTSEKQHAISYVFEVAHSGTDYYPIFTHIDAGMNQGTFISSGSAIINFRHNAGAGKHPFIISQTAANGSTGWPRDVTDSTDCLGPSDSYPAVFLTTEVMWWGENMEGLTPNLQLMTESGIAVADGAGEWDISHTAYPFSSDMLTSYTVRLDEASLDGVIDGGQINGVALDYYKDGSVKSRHEELPFQIYSMVGLGNVESSSTLSDSLKHIGDAMNTNANSNMSFGDKFVQIALNLVAKEECTGGEKFSMQLAPTGDPTKFIGFISLRAGKLKGGSSVEDDVTGITIMSDGKGEAEFKYTPGLGEIMVLAGKKTPQSYAMKQIKAINRVLKRKGTLGYSFEVGGYMQSLVYYDFDSGSWKIKILSGGFDAGAGLSYSWNWNTMCGPVPFTATLTIGGLGQVSMDALAVSAYDTVSHTSGIGNDFLTELRIELYIRFFGGVGFDYSVVAFKLGVFGQLNLVMQFDWLNRPYMEGGGIINVADGRSDGNLNGQRFRITGQIGLELIMKFLFIKYEKILYSFSFQLLDENTGQWTQIQDSWEKNSKASTAAIEGLMENGSLTSYSAGGQQMLSLNLAPALESREYLSEGWRTWGNGGIGLFSLDADNGLANLESNTYPYANPVVSDDGKLVAYLSDMGSSDAEVTRAAYAVKDGSSYARRTAISDDGYGDSQLSLSGTEDFAVSTWTRQAVALKKENGTTLTSDDQMMMLNGTEVYASVYSGGSWSTTRLTDNSSPDLAPVVAVNGDRAIVAWRSVSASGALAEDNGNVPSMTNFDERDNIVYKMYADGVWGETQTLYNGTSGNVKGIVTAMLEDGTAAVAYTLDTDRKDGTVTDREIVYAVVGADGQVLRNVQATNDAYLDENPQLTAVRFGGEQRFVLGWYTEQAAAADSAAVLDGGGGSPGGETVSDIRLLEFDASGTTGQLLPDSINQAANAYDVSITSNFRFTKNSDTISDLSILWVERAGRDDETEIEKEVEKDVLKGVKFYTYGQNNELISFTGAVDVAEMGDATLIDHFDAYVSNSAANEIMAVILGSTYGANGAVTRTAETVGGNTVQYTVPSRTSAMYTATETYQDTIQVPAFLADYETVKRGAVTQIQFTVDNKGIHAIRRLTIQVGDTTTVYDGLNLLPGGSIQLTADYQVPESGVVDPIYIVTAAFDETAGATGTAETGESRGFFGLGARAGSNVATGTIYLDLPDVEITDARIVREENGERTIQIKLNNHADAVLAKENRKVKISFYSDAACTTLLESLPPVIISGEEELAMLDEGGYSTQITFQVGDHVKNGEDVQEIPESGVNVYMEAEVLDQEDIVQGEPVFHDNYASVTCENLKVRTGKDVIITSDMETNDSGSKVTVSLQNTRLSSTTTGNVIATLLDQDGAVLEQLQSYTGGSSDGGLLSLNGEEKKTTSFQFSRQGSSVQITYSDLVLDTDNANLASLRFEGLPGVSLESFQEDPSIPGIYRAAASADDLTSTALIAAAESAFAKIRLTDEDEGSNAVSRTVDLKPGETNTITARVTAGSGAVKTYILTVQNNGDPVIDPIPSSPEAGEYSASVYYGSDDSATINLNVAATGGGTLTYQWYSCDMAGNSAKPVQDATASTLTVPNTQLPGVYYYRCKVTRHMVSGGTKDYWSSVASVEVRQGNGNAVTVMGTTVDFDNRPHGLTSVSAAVEGSTFHYSIDGGAAWSETPPTFIAAGVHTVWVKAAALGYAETAVVTADVVIRQKSGTLFKLETQALEDVFASYPQSVQEKYGNASALSEALKTEITAFGVSESNTAVYDVKLLFSLDGGSTWNEATKDNFPPEGVTVTLPYPAGTDRIGYNFVLQHLIIDPLNTGKTAGEIETMDITLEDSGIRFTADCLSPFVLGWSARPSGGFSDGFFDSSSNNDSYGGKFGSISYPVTVKGSEHGKVTVNPTRASYGSIVTVTAKPDQGYQTDTITVTAQNGRTLTVTKKDGDTYTFVMPYGAVSVAAVFAPLPDDTQKPCNGGETCPSGNFIDLGNVGVWYHEAVDYVLRNELMVGYGGGLFGPNNALSRAQLAQILYNQEGKPAITGSCSFSDVTSGAWYANAITWAAAKNIVNGYGDERFGVNDNITREQLAVMLWRYAGSPAATDKSLPFTDVSEAGKWALDGLHWAVENGILSGYGDGRLGPKGLATRAQVAQVLTNFLDVQKEVVKRNLDIQN